MSLLAFNGVSSVSKPKRIAGVAAAAFLAALAGASAVSAGECTSNRFQPTFVRHNSVAPQVYYVEPNGSFTPMRNPAEAQAVCQARGVRQLIGGQSCFQRNWGDFGCGCNITPSPNATCARFQRALAGRTNANDNYCRNLYSQMDGQNRAGNRFRAGRNLNAARSSYQNAMRLAQQGANDPRCLRFRNQFRNALSVIQRNMQRVFNDSRNTRPPVSSANPFCDRYARTAVAQNQVNVQLRCGLSGSRWQSNYSHHYNWCVTAGTSMPNYEERNRAAALDRCRARRR